MKKLIVALAVFAGVASVNAQEEQQTPKQGWTRGGNISFLFNQSAFNADWLGGGRSNMAGNLGVNYDYNYVNGDWNWDNKLIAAYGLTKIKGDERTTKSDDRLEFNSLLGKKAGNNWYYSGFLNFRSQFDKGYKIDEATGARTEISRGLSPAYLQVGPGMLWKKHDNLKVNIAPVTSRFIFIDDFFTKNASAFGVEKGETFRYELGASLSGYYKANLMENVSVENILNLYSNYLEDPQNVDIDYTMNLVMAINKYLSANVAFQAIYDDNATKAFQIREVFGLGVNYQF